MKTFTKTFKIISKEVMDHDSKYAKPITYNPKFNSDIMNDIRKKFERGIDGTFNDFCSFFKIKETKIADEFTVTTDIDRDFNNREFTISASIIPMRKRDYARIWINIVEKA